MISLSSTVVDTLEKSESMNTSNTFLGGISTIHADILLQNPFESNLDKFNRLPIHSADCDGSGLLMKY